MKPTYVLYERGKIDLNIPNHWDILLPDAIIGGASLGISRQIIQKGFTSGKKLGIGRRNVVRHDEILS